MVLVCTGAVTHQCYLCLSDLLALLPRIGTCRFTALFVVPCLGSSSLSNSFSTSVFPHDFCISLHQSLLMTFEPSIAPSDSIVVRRLAHTFIRQTGLPLFLDYVVCLWSFSLDVFFLKIY